MLVDQRGEIAIEALVAWASEQRRQLFGGLRLVLVPNPLGGGAGPDDEFALPLR